MTDNAATKPTSTPVLWIGRIIGVLPALLLLAGGVMNVTKAKDAVEGAAKFGYAESTVVPLGVALIASTLLFLFPRTAVLGAILLTGWLGGAVATHVRAGDPVFNIVFPVVFAAVLWLSLVLREPRLRGLVPLRS